MSNLSYCRFRNTLPDLRDCIEALAERETLTLEEMVAAQAMLKMMVRFLEDEAVLEEPDYSILDDILTDMREEA